jgi:hypothetical protein
MIEVAATTELCMIAGLYRCRVCTDGDLLISHGHQPLRATPDSGPCETR